MKKIFSLVVLALAMSLAFTGCASKKAENEAGPKLYTLDLGNVVSIVSIDEQKQLFNVSALFPNDVKFKAGDAVKVKWSFVTDADVGKVYISCGDNSEDYVFCEDVKANDAVYQYITMPLDLDVAGPLFNSIWSDTKAMCETTYIDAK